MDDQLTVLVKSVRRLGQELAEMDTTEIALRIASGRIEDMSGDIDDYLFNLTWERAIEKAWAEAGMQSEEDAEYG